MSRYTDLATVRAMSELDDTTAYPDADLLEGIAYAETLIDVVTKTTWTYVAFSVTLSGNDRSSLRLCDEEGFPILYPRTLTSVTIDTVAQTTTNWALFPDGVIVRDTGVFTYTFPGLNVVVAGTAGLTASAPDDIAWCARTLARQYVIDLSSRVPDRATQVQNDYGTVTLAQASANPDRPTNLPDVNSRLIKRRQYMSVFG